MTETLFTAKFDLIQSFPIVTMFTDSPRVEIKLDVHDAKPLVTIDLSEDDEPYVAVSFTHNFSMDEIEAIFAYARAINPRNNKSTLSIHG